MVSVKQTIFSGRFTVFFLLLISFLLVNSLAACKGRDSYKTELSQKNIPYSIDSFLLQAAKGNKDAVILFTKSGMDVNARDNKGRTALMAASVNRQTDMVRLLISKGADVNLKDMNGYTALMEASFQGKIEIVKLFVDKGADVNAISNNGFTALSIALSSGKTDIADLLRKTGAKG